MGSSEGGPGEGGLGTECSVGTIVWVRRRNGSWWPGRILGQHELSASHLMSPRSGTPVKLLGREDASVDWYNLEKSKRVKAFRCGEFDACIERAEASLGGPIRKREKYARREDAILHALELEKRQQDTPQPSNGPALKPPTAAMKKELVSLPPFDEPVTKLLEVSGSGASLAWEDEVSGLTPRMRGLQDFRLPIVPLKKSSIFDDHGDGHHADSSMHGKNSLAVKRKRSQGGLAEESLSKRRDRRRPLVQVLKSSAKLPAIPLPSSESNCELASAAYFPTNSAGNSPDQMPVSPVDYAYDSNGLHAAGSSSLEGIGEASSDERDEVGVDLVAEDFLLQEDESFLEDEDVLGKFGGGGYEPSISDSRHLSLSNDEGDGAADPGVSKWHMKGKRNVRSHLLKKGILVEPPPSYYRKKKSSGVSRLFNGGGDEDELSPGRAFGWRSSFWGADLDNEEELLELPRGRAFGNAADRKPPLVEVELKVQTSYQGERVPLVSLMSRLNGKAIIGHPVPVEILEDGAAEMLALSCNETLEKQVLDGATEDGHPSAAAAPVWRTGRRTAMHRVPRTHLAPTADEAELDGSYSEGLFREPPAAGGGGGGGSGTTTQSSASRKKASSGKAKKRPHKKGVISLSNQKTRTLSSIVTERRRSSKSAASRHGRKEGGRGSSLGGLIKPGGSTVPLVTCVPIKVVFSRIMEAVGRPPSSTTTARRALPAAPPDTRPSSSSSSLL